MTHPNDPGLMLTDNETEVLAKMLDVAILATPTGKHRNTLTDINIKLMAVRNRLFVGANAGDEVVS
jgi:hypothetical protein